jgi:hypothetical protein
MRKNLLFPFILICLWIVLVSQSTLAESTLEFLRRNIQPGLNVYECEAKVSKEANFVKFKLLQRTTTTMHTYELWSVTVLQMPYYRLLVDNGIIQSVTEHPGLSR